MTGKGAYQLERRLLGKTGWEVSPVGFGSYRIDDKTPAHREALQAALTSGCNLIDTSSNYTDGGSERLIGSVVGAVKPRDEIHVVTKAGYVQGEQLELARLRISQGKPIPEMVQFAHDCWHCISPEFLSMQIQRSLTRLGFERLDALLLHNPEYFLRTEPDHAEYYRRIRQAFEYLETEVERGRIGWDGISSNTLAHPKDAPDYTSLEVLLELANAIRPDHHFAIIEFPFNLFEPGGALERNNSGKTVLELAQENHLGVLTNRPLNAFNQGRLLRLADFPSHPARDLETELQEALTHVMQLESSYPESSDLPVKRMVWGHAIRKNFLTLVTPETWHQVRFGQIEPAIRGSLELLAGHSELAPWADEYRFRTEELFEILTAYVESEASSNAKRLAAKLDELCPELKTEPTLVRKVLKLSLSVPGIDCVLLGMRQPRYVADATATAELIAPERALATLQSLNEDPS